MTHRILVLAATGAGLAAPAFAGGPTTVPPEPVVMAPAPMVTPDRDWTGPYVGAQLGWGWADAEDDADGHGAIGGLQGGYRYDFGRFVLGGEAQYDWGHIDLGDDQGSLDSIGRLKLDAGYDAGPALVYGTVGAARASASLDGEDYGDWGYVAGAGVDYMLTDRVSLGGEVLYHGFDDFDDTGRDLSATTVEAGVTFRF